MLQVSVLMDKMSTIVLLFGIASCEVLKIVHTALRNFKDALASHVRGKQRVSALVHFRTEAKRLSYKWTYIGAFQFVVC